MLRAALLILLAVLFVLAGLNHFLHPATYLAMLPPYLPYPDVLNYIIGAAGIGMLMPQGVAHV